MHAFHGVPFPYLVSPHRSRRPRQERSTPPVLWTISSPRACMGPSTPASARTASSRLSPTASSRAAVGENHHRLRSRRVRLGGGRGFDLDLPDAVPPGAAITDCSAPTAFWAILEAYFPLKDGPHVEAIFRAIRTGSLFRSCSNTNPQFQAQRSFPPTFSTHRPASRSNEPPVRYSRTPRNIPAGCFRSNRCAADVAVVLNPPPIFGRRHAWIGRAWAWMAGPP